MQFEKNLTLLRKQKNLTQEELAFLVGVSRQTIYSWEGGLNYPNILMLKKLSNALDVTTDELLNGFMIFNLPKKLMFPKLTYVSKHKGDISYKELPNWFIELKKYNEVCFGLYDLYNGELVRDYSYNINVCDDVIIHDFNGTKIEVKEYNPDLEFVKKYDQYISCSNEGIAWIGESRFINDKQVIKTYKDQDFLDKWGSNGKLKYFNNKYIDNEDYLLEINNKIINVIKISYLESDNYFEVYLNEDFESLIWIRYTKKELKKKLNNISKTINNTEYDLDYYSITSRLFVL